MLIAAIIGLVLLYLAIGWCVQGYMMAEYNGGMTYAEDGFARCFVALVWPFAVVIALCTYPAEQFGTFCGYVFRKVDEYSRKDKGCTFNPGYHLRKKLKKDPCITKP